MLKRFLIATLTLATLIASANDLKTLQAKADRFMAQKEWASASAMYSLILDSIPASTQTYGRAIVVAAIQNEEPTEIDLLHRALLHGVEIDSLFSEVERTSFDIGRSSLYEDFLKLVQQKEPWLSRTVDSYLLRYYTFRSDGPAMIRLSKKLLEGIPDNEQFLYTLARGYVITGDYRNAMATFVDIVNLNPKAYDALLYLGNYYSTDSERTAEAEAYLRRAYDIKPTPYVAQKLAALKGNR